MKMTTFSAKAHPSVKGIYLAIFLIFFAIPILAQVEKKDSDTTSHKWEVAFDLKPLFRKDEPYNLIVKKHFTQRKSIRIGIGANEIKNNIIEDYEVLQSLGPLLDSKSKIQYFQGSMNASEKSNILQFSLGFQYKFLLKKVIFYSATDLVYSKTSTNYDLNVTSVGIRDSSLNIITFDGYDPLRLLINKISNYSAKQSFGLQYPFNKSLSLSIEASLSFNHGRYSFEKRDKPIANQVVEKFTTKIGNVSKGVLEPIAGIFLNYHF